MLGAGGTLPLGAGSGTPGGGSSSYVGRDIVWVDLRFNPGVGDGTEARPFNTANIGLAALPESGTLMLVGDASNEPGVSIGARSFTAVGLGAQIAGSALSPPALPTITYAITSGAQRIALRHVTASIVQAGAASGLTQFTFEFCPVIQLAAGSDTPTVYCVGDRTCTLSGSGGLAHLRGINVAGYAANGGASVFMSNTNVTGDVTSSTSITFYSGCSFGSGVSITAPSISIDPASHKSAVAAGVTFSSTPQILASFGTPVDVGTANAQGTGTGFARVDHVHNFPFAALVAAAALASSAIGFNGQRLTTLGAPVGANDAVRLVDLQGAIQGLQVKTAAVAVATSNQATLSGTAQTIDGVALNTVGQRVLLTAQTTATQNGLWVVQSGAWTRPTDFATGAHAALSYVPISGGTLWAGSSYYCTTASGSDTIDTNNLAWTIFNIPATVTAGAGLTKTGTTIDVVAADATITVNADSIQVGVIGNANLADNTIALSRLVNAGAQYDFLMRNSSGAGPWERATLAQAQAALGIVASGALKAVRMATTANITLSGTQSIDGVSGVAGDRVLVKNQTTASQNGVYVMAAGAWARASDASSAGQLFAGLCVPIGPEGTTQGKRVALLTTADPIIIGTTALTFALDRIIPAASVAPADVTDGAAAIGTSNDGARADHVHHLGFAALAAVLAVASSSISVNAQKITNLATPTISTDAATKGYVDTAISTVIGSTIAPANPGDNNKVVYAFGGALAYASQLKTDGTYLAHGTNPASTGNQRWSYGNLVYGKGDGTTVTGDVQLIKWGLSGGTGLDDSIIFGDSNVGSEVWNVKSNGIYLWNWASFGFVSFSTNGYVFTQQAVTTGAPPTALTVTGATHTGLTAGSEVRDVTFNLARTVTLATGAVATTRSVRFQPPTYAFAAASTVTTAATVAISGAPSAGTNATITNALALWIEAGAIGHGGGTLPATGLHRFGNNAGILAAYRSYNSTDRSLLQLSGNGTTFDDFLVGDSTAADGNNSLYLQAKAQVVVAIAATSLAQFSSAGGLNMGFSGSQLPVTGISFASWGATPATGGAARFTNGNQVAWMNAAGSANIVGIQVSSGNVLVLGDSAAVNNGVEMQVGSAGNTGVNFDVKIANAFKYRFGNSNATWFGTNLILDTGFIQQGAQPALGGTIRLTASAGLGGIWFRNNANTLDLAGLFGGTDDVTYLGDGANGVGVNIRAKTTGFIQAIFGSNAPLNVQQGALTFAPVLANSGTAPVALTITGAAHTGLATATEARDISFALARTVTMNTGALGTQRAIYVTAPIYAFAGASTITTAATMALSGAPVAGTNATITRSYTLLIENGGIGFGALPAAGTAALNFTSNTTIASGRSSGGIDRPLIVWNASDIVQVGSGNIAVQLIGGAGTWSFSVGGVASFPGVAHNLAAGATINIGTTPSANGIINFSSSATVLLGAKDAIANDRDLLTWNNANSFTLGNTSVTTVITAFGNSWSFGSIASLAGVEHRLAASGFYSYGTSASGIGLHRTPYASGGTTFLGTKDSGGTDRTVLGYSGSTNHVQVGSSALTTDVLGSGGTWAFGASASFPAVDHNIAAGGRLTMGSTPASGGTIAFSYGGSLLWRNKANSGDRTVLFYGLDSGTDDSLILGDTGVRQSMYRNQSGPHQFEIGGSVKLQISGTAIFFLPIDLSGNRLVGLTYAQFLSQSSIPNPSTLGWNLACNSSGDLVAVSNTGTTRTIAVH